MMTARSYNALALLVHDERSCQNENLGTCRIRAQPACKPRNPLLFHESHKTRKRIRISISLLWRSDQITRHPYQEDVCKNELFGG